MSENNQTPTSEEVIAATLQGLPPLDFEVVPEDLISKSESGPVLNEDPARNLEDYKYKRLEKEIEELGQKLSERRDLHSIRTWHAWLLFGLTVGWVVVIWLVVLLQGFGQWFLSIPALAPNEEYLAFELSDTVIVAFMTSTTATVLGLYGIAAYWLYGKSPSLKKGEAEAVHSD